MGLMGLTFGLDDWHQPRMTTWRLKRGKLTVAIARPSSVGSYARAAYSPFWLFGPLFGGWWNELPWLYSENGPLFTFCKLLDVEIKDEPMKNESEWEVWDET